MYAIAVINESTVLTDAQVKPMVDAINTQIHRDFSNLWGLYATLTLFPKGDAIPLGMFQVAILDDSDQAGALGYHDMTADGKPVGKVFARDDINDGISVSVTLSHEVLEMIVDPYVNLMVQADKIYAREVCDACEDDSFGYAINGVLVSDFVTPAWFEAPRAGARYDFMNHITAPFQLLSGGYISIYEPTYGWTQIAADAAPTRRAARSHEGSRRDRRG